MQRNRSDGVWMDCAPSILNLRNCFYQQCQFLFEKTNSCFHAGSNRVDCTLIFISHDIVLKTKWKCPMWVIEVGFPVCFSTHRSWWSVPGSLSAAPPLAFRSTRAVSAVWVLPLRAAPLAQEWRWVEEEMAALSVIPCPASEWSTVQLSGPLQPQGHATTTVCSACRETRDPTDGPTGFPWRQAISTASPLAHRSRGPQAVVAAPSGACCPQTRLAGTPACHWTREDSLIWKQRELAAETLELEKEKANTNFRYLRLTEMLKSIQLLRFVH